MTCGMCGTGYGWFRPEHGYCQWETQSAAPSGLARANTHDRGMYFLVLVLGR